MSNLTLIIFIQNEGFVETNFMFHGNLQLTLVGYQILVPFIVFELFSRCKLDPDILHILSVINISNYSPTLLIRHHRELKLFFS